MRPAQALTPDSLVREMDIPIEDARKIIGALYRDALDVIPKGVRRTSYDRFREAYFVPSLEVAERIPSREDPFLRFGLLGPDRTPIETVRIPLEKTGRFTVCVSSQVGCALACGFCATGSLGFSRNLEPWEIVEQVRIVRRTLDPSRAERVHGVVFQGMGEPLLNLESVLVALRVMSDPCALAIDARNITVCTAGIPAGIRALADRAPRVRLAWSLTSAREETRRALMPITARYSIDEVFEEVAAHTQKTGLAPMWAIALLSDQNDSLADAEALASLATRFVDKTGRRPRISLVPYNESVEVGSRFRRATRQRQEAFRDALASLGFPPHLRYSGGGDVRAACGQLAPALSSARKTRLALAE